ncbi:MAG: PKD domain-containing protein, partial [Bacteroidetes bacterium]|nr:PKD domain-containing protein [Bacteroidota bacterium]
QVLFGQKNNGTATTPSSNDGLTIDDISLWQDVKDIGIAQMTQPLSGCGLTNAEQVKIDVFNYGTDITNKTGTINMRVNNGNVISQNVNFNILRNSTQSFTFTQTIDLSAPGTYAIKTWTSLTGDADSTNDSLTEQISVGSAMTPLTITASGATALCFGDSVTLTANSGYTSYLWSNGKTTPTITVKSASNYICTVSNNIGCKLSKNQNVTLSYKPIAGFNWFVNNSTVSFTNLTANGVTYKWYFGDGDSSALNSPNHTYSALGIYNVELYAYNACGASVDKHDVNIKNIGIKNIEPETLNITPNPFLQSFHLSVSDANTHYIKLLDIRGRIVKEITTKEQNILIEVPELAAGIYLLQIDGLNTHKLIKE